MQFRQRSTRAGLLSAEQLDQIDARVEDLIEDSVRRAKSDPKPDPAALLSDVYVSYP
ncbi:Acetoin:2,6-dichlorophenolindophenol oxidoreductase subunit alpha [compost metagenome]